MSGIYKGDDWWLGKTEVDGKPVLVRARAGLPNAPDREIYENLISILWLYPGQASGMPEQDEQDRASQFEEAIEKTLEVKGLGVQVACITGNSSREWRYYTYDTEEFISKLNQGLRGHPVYPLAFRVYKDPEWLALSELLPKPSPHHGASDA